MQLSKHLFLAVAFFSLTIVPACSHLGNNITRSARITEIDTISDVLAMVDSKIAIYGSEHVLVVFDIDDTLLTMPQALGGVGWYDWQAGLSRAPQEQMGELGDNLLAAQGVLFEASRMVPVEVQTVEVIKQISQRGVATHAMTARGPQFFGPTFREIQNNGIEFVFPDNCVAPLCVHPGIVSFDALKRNLLDRYSEDELEELGLKASRNALEANGILLVAGQHKGLMLDLLLRSYPDSDFRAVIFVDDSQSNVQAVSMVAPYLDVEINAVHYFRLNNENEQLIKDQTELGNMSDRWQRIESSTCQAVQSRICKQ